MRASHHAGVPLRLILLLAIGAGSGAAARDLLAEARRHAPCVVLIEDMPAVGTGPLLGEMDALGGADGVVVVATAAHGDVAAEITSRGRFEHVLSLGLPDAREREAILRVHARQAPVARDVHLADVARRSTGMVGAELVDVLEEAAVLTARRVDETLACPQTGAKVHCVVLRSPRSGACVGVERCSGESPACTRSCEALLARGVPLLAPRMRAAAA